MQIFRPTQLNTNEQFQQRDFHRRPWAREMKPCCCRIKPISLVLRNLPRLKERKKKLKIPSHLVFAFFFFTHEYEHIRVHVHTCRGFVLLMVIDRKCESMLNTKMFVNATRGANTLMLIRSETRRRSEMVTWQKLKKQVLNENAHECERCVHGGLGSPSKHKKQFFCLFVLH